MIPALPAELLIKILDLATSPSYAVSARKDDHQLLRQCCLASKQLCAVAQPMLWSVFTSDGDLSTLSKFTQHAQHVRVLDYVSGYRVRRFVGMLSNLTDLCISGGTLAETNVGAFRNVRHLTLRHAEIPSLFPVVFHNLTSLTVGFIQPTLRTANTLFPAMSFPSLRAVYVQGFIGSEEVGQSTLLDFANLTHLDVLQVNAEHSHLFTPKFHQAACPVLLAFPTSWSRRVSTECTSFEHLLLLKVARFEGNAQLWTEYYGRRLEALTIAVATRKTPLLSRSLPSTLSPSSPLPLSLAVARNALLNSCTVCGVDIIWRPYSKTVEDDLGVSRDFWEYATELKRKKAVEIAATEANWSGSGAGFREGEECSRGSGAAETPDVQQEQSGC